MPGSDVRRAFAALALAALIVPVASAQTTSPNADIMRMVQAGLPEAVVIDKINAGAGHWDTSIDALITLKAIGATPAEMKALTSPVAATPGHPAGGGAAAAAQPLPAPLLRTAAKDPYLQFPEKNPTLFPDGTHSNQAFLVAYEGKPAIRIPAQHIHDGAKPGNWTSGNLILTATTVVYDPYLVEVNAGYYPKNGKYVMEKGAVKEAKATAYTIPSNDVFITYGDGPLENRTTLFSKTSSQYNVGFHYSGVAAKSETPVLCRPVENCSSPQLDQFVKDLTHDFDAAIAPILAAAGITDVDKQLSGEAHYRPVSVDDFPKYAAIYQKQLDGTPAPPKQGLMAFAKKAKMPEAPSGAPPPAAAPAAAASAPPPAPTALAMPTAPALPASAPPPPKGSAPKSAAPAPGASATPVVSQPAPAPSPAVTVAPSPVAAANAPVLTCVAQSYPSNELRVSNNCDYPLYVEWWVGERSGNWTVQGNDHAGTGYSTGDIAKAGGVAIYVCPQNRVPVDGSGQRVKGTVPNYQCVVQK